MSNPPQPHPEPPRKRYRLRLELDAHDEQHMAELLEEIAIEARWRNLPSSRVSSAGYHFSIDDLGPEQTDAKYEEELAAWLVELRNAAAGVVR